MPSKILLRGAHVAHTQAAHPFDGVTRSDPIIDCRAMVAQQQARVDELRAAKYEDILAANPAIELRRGFASFADAHTVVVRRPDGSEQSLTPDRIFVATGASPLVPEIPGLSDTPYWTSTEALVAEELPGRLLVLGGSFVALELAQAFRRLGAEVTVLARSTFLSKEDPALGEGLQRAFEDEGIRVLLHTVPTQVEEAEDEARDRRFESFSSPCWLLLQQGLEQGRRPALRAHSGRGAGPVTPTGTTKSCRRKRQTPSASWHT